MHNKSFAATCAYVAREGAILLGGNMLGIDANELTREFQLLCSLRPSINKPVVHIVGAFAPGDRLSDADMLAVAERYLTEQGYKGSLFSVWRHFDGTTDHFHAITCAIDLNGKPISQSFERYRTKRSCRMLEREFGLTRVGNIARKPVELPPLPPKAEPDGLDIEIPSVTTEVADAFSRLIREALPGCATVADLARALAIEGLRMVPQIHNENGEIYGMGFRMETGPLTGSFVPGSKIPGNFSARKLVTKHGLSLQPERDLPILANPLPDEPVVPAVPAAPAPKPQAPKHRRTKKGDRRNARRNRKPSRLSTSGTTPWLPGTESLQTLLPDSRGIAGTRLGDPLLVRPEPGATPPAICS
jgi:hypothetical protein